MDKKKKTGIIVGIIILAVVVAAVFYFMEQNRKSTTYLAGMEAYQNGDYAAAREAFESIGDYENAKEILIEVDYQDAIVAIEQEGDDARAEELLLPIKDYKDAESYLYQITYRKVKRCMNEGDYIQAEEYAKEIIGYEDVAQLMQEIIYHQAINKVDEMDFEGAKALLSTMTDATLAQKGMDRISYSKYCVPCVQDLYSRYTEGVKVDKIDGGRYCEVTYNSGNSFPVIMIQYTVVTDAGEAVEQYAAYNNYDFFGTCDTIDVDKLDMTNQAQMATFLKIEPNWNSPQAIELSGPVMQQLAGY